MNLLAIVALTIDLPVEGLHAGDRGTIVEIYAPGVFEVEFCDDNGQTLALCTLEARDLRLIWLAPQPSVRQ